MDIITNEICAKAIINKSNLPVCDYSVNPYVGCPHACMYCYASFMKRFSGHVESWGNFLDIKNWQDINNPKKYQGKEIFIGSVTDPYNIFEEKYRRTRAILEQLQGSGAKITIQTKSDLVLRDIDLLKTFPDIRVGFSINTLDEDFQKDMDFAPSIERRISAMKSLHELGIRTTCFISPIFPAITDVEEIIDRVKYQCNLIWLENLNLRGSFKKAVLDYINDKYPQLRALYNEIYLNSDLSYWIHLEEKIANFLSSLGLRYLRDDDHFIQPFDAKPTVVNFFYHELIKKSVKKNKDIHFADN